MKTISACKNLHEFHAVIKDVEGPVLGKGGGRKFMVQGKEVSMNTLVHKYFALLKKAPVSQEGHDSAILVLDKLDNLNHMKLDLHPNQQKKLAFRQKWGNFFAKVKYGPAFSHKNLRTDALKIYMKNFLREIEQKGVPGFKKIASNVQRKKITHDEGNTQLGALHKTLPKDALLKDFVSPDLSATIIKRLAKPLAKKVTSILAKINPQQ